MQRIPPRNGVAFRLKRGQSLTVVDPFGKQVADLVAFSEADPKECISNGRTFDYEETLRLTRGHRIWSNRSRVFLTIEEDSLGCHDFLLAPCSVDTFRHFYPDAPVHHGCLGNLADALAPYGIDPDGIPVAFNCFMNVSISPQGQISVDTPRSEPGESIRLRANEDLVVGLTACAAYASNGGEFKPIDYSIVSEAVRS